MDTVSLTLALIDEISQPSKKAEDALKHVEEQAKKTGKSLDFGKEMSQAQVDLAKMLKDPKGFQAAIKAQEAIKAQKKKILDDLKGPDSFISGVTNKFSFARIASAAAVGGLIPEGALSVCAALVDSAKAAVSILTSG